MVQDAFPYFTNRKLLSFWIEGLITKLKEEAHIQDNPFLRLGFLHFSMFLVFFFFFLNYNT